MSKMCDEEKSLDHNSSLYGSRRDFLKEFDDDRRSGGIQFIEAVVGAATNGGDDPPRIAADGAGSYVIRRCRDVDGRESGDFPQADVLVEGKGTWIAVGPHLHAGGAAEIDGRGRIVMPGFV